MTNPVSNFAPRPTPGESEMSWGRGMLPPLERAAVDGFFPSNYDRLVATRQTDASNPDADEDATFTTTAKESIISEKTGMYEPHDLRPGVTKRVVERGPSSSSGQHKPVDVTKYNPGHLADGQQDGSGDTWRASFPTEASRYHGPYTTREDL